MANSVIVVTFNSIPALNSSLNFVDDISENKLMTFVEIRSQKAECTADQLSSAVVVAANYVFAMERDYNNTGLYTITRVSNVVTITATNPTSSFSILLNDTGGAVTTVITNNLNPPEEYSMVVSILEAANPCADVKYSVQGTPQATSISSPIIQAVASNPFEFEYPRQPLTLIQMSNGLAVDFEFMRIPLLLSAYFEIEVVNAAGGVIVTVESVSDMRNIAPEFILEYSLDDVVWDLANSWSGLQLANGTYPVWVRDNIGCKIELSFDVDNFVPNLVDYDPIFEISNVNSLRFKEVVSWSYNGIKKTIDNTLSYEENSKINNRRYIQPFQKNQTIRTQIKSNYATITATATDCDGNETDLPVVKMTENIDKTDVRDGTILQSETNTVGVRFGAGNTYDPISSLVNGSYNILQYLMDWVNIGDYLNIEGLGWAKIINITSPTDEIPYYVAWTSSPHNLFFTVDQVVKITSVYNVVDFDRHEFSIIMSGLDGNYQIKANATDTRTDFPDKELLSEWINVVEEIEDSHLFEWYSTRNNEINYGTGVSFAAWFPFVRNLKWKPNEEQEIYVTDTKTINLDSKVRGYYELNLMPIPTAMAQKVVLILAHNRIFIDGQSYLLEGETEVLQLGSTNTYQLKANLVRADYVFDATTGVTAGEILTASGTPLEIDGNANGLLFIE